MLVKILQDYKNLELVECIAFLNISLSAQSCDKMLPSLNNFILYFQASQLRDLLSCSSVLISSFLEANS